MCLSFGLLGNAQVGYARSLSERREQLIIGLMSGFTKDFTLDEVEQYLTFEEVNVLETGGIRSISSYGIDNEHSTSQTIYLSWLNSNKKESIIQLLSFIFFTKLFKLSKGSFIIIPLFNCIKWLEYQISMVQLGAIVIHYQLFLSFFINFPVIGMLIGNDLDS